MKKPPKSNTFLASFREVFGFSRRLAFAMLFLSCVFVALSVIWFIYSLPPRTLSITCGISGSTYQTMAEKYREILARNDVKLRVLDSQGSAENLQRLDNPKFRVDIGFVQGGLTNHSTNNPLVSLGSVAYEPLLVFYRGEKPLVLLSELNGKRVAIGAPGSGTRMLALAMLAENGIRPGSATILSDLDTAEAARAMLEGTVDAVFMMGDSASGDLIRQLLLKPGIQLVDFVQADAYIRRINYLNKLVLPRGAIDFGKDLPAHDINLLGPTVEILARPNVHPALVYLLEEAMQEVNGQPGLFKRRSEFPALVEHDFPISPAANRFAKSGKGYIYNWLPFWLASRIAVLVVFIPLLVVLLPAFKAIPFVLRLRMNMHIYRWYRELLAFERDLGNLTPAKRAELAADLNDIDEQVNRLKVPPSFAEQFYDLRQHIQFVRVRLLGAPPPSPIPDSH